MSVSGNNAIISPFHAAGTNSRLVQDTVGDKALRVVDGAIYVAKSAPLGTAVKVTFSTLVRTRFRPLKFNL